jgi:hypothetical protein
MSENKYREMPPENFGDDEETPIPMGTRRRAPRGQNAPIPYAEELAETAPAAPARRGYGCADVLTALFLLLTVLVISLTILLISNPYSPFNPLPPRFGTIEVPVYVSATPLPTWTPSITPTPEPPTPTVPSPTPSLTPTLTPSLTPTATFTPVFGNTNGAAEGTPSAATPEQPQAQFTRSLFPFTAAVNYQQNVTAEGCNWHSIAGAIFDLQGKPLPGLALRITSQDLSIDEYHYSGQQKRFGESGFEAYLGAAPKATRYIVQLLGRTSQPISDSISVTTRTSCEQNVVFITFQQNHSF